MSENKRPGVMFYFGQCAVLRQMPMEDAYALMMATLDFAEHGVVPEFKNPALTYAWSFIQLSVERDSARYDRVVEQRRKAAERRWAKKQQDETNADACILCQPQTVTLKKKNSENCILKNPLVPP